MLQILLYFLLLADQTAAFSLSHRVINKPLSPNGRRAVQPLFETSSTTTEPPTTTTNPNTVVHVQRKYETFFWNFKKPVGDGDEDISKEDPTYAINFRVEGPKKGPPLLLIHGFGGNVNHFRYNIPLLAKEGYRVYAIDLLGFGASDKPKDEDFSMELFIQQVSDFMKSRNEDRPWTVCGNSIGGVISLGVAAGLSEMVQSVVLFNSAGGMSGFRYEDVPWIFRPIMYFVQKVVLGPDNGPKFFKNFKTRENVESILKTQGVYGDTTNVDEELLELILGPSEDEGAEEVFLRVFAGPAGPPPEYFLPKISCPILALWGDKDPWTPAQSGRMPSGSMFGDYTNDYTLDLIPGAGHCPHDEAPEYCHNSMVKFLESARNRYDPQATAQNKVA